MENELKVFKFSESTGFSFSSCEACISEASTSGG